MRKLFIFIIALSISFAKVNSTNSATRSSSSKNNSRRNITTTTLPAPNELECQENIDYCFNYYCFNKKTLTNGIYSRCGSESASNIVINVNDCLDTRGIIKNLNLKDGCKAYTYTSVVALLANKDNIETSIKKTTKECKEAITTLNAAKSCWAKMISHDGSIDPSLRTQLVSLCGYSISKDADMVDRFYNAGNYGDSNIGAQMDMELTGQNTQKRENWRQVVDSVLAGYTEMAELACGEEDYQITKINDYTPDNRENLAMVKATAQADQMGRSTANRIVNSWFRETDCLNSPLPKGGLKWEYIANGAPDCRIVCLEGYEEGPTSSECVEKKTQTITFGGFVTSEKAVVGEPTPEPIQPQPFIPTTTAYSNPFNEPDSASQTSSTSSSGTCSTNLPRQYYAQNSTPTASEICRIFFPNCTSGNIGSRNSYSRETTNGKEYFCIGKYTNNYNYWVDLSLAEINKVFGKSFTRFGENYNGSSSTDAGKFLYENCANYCNGNTPTPTPTNTSSSNYEKQIKKACEKLDHKGWSIKNNKEKMKYCTETMLPAYCKPTLSQDQLKKCIDTFSLTTGNMTYNCTSKTSFDKCVWSRNFNPATWHKSWYSIETSSNGSKYLIFNKYIIHPEDLYYSLPFADFDEMFP
ncbi:MAG: hypothetical protein ACI4N3_02105 [Alphaproteobacteria bacterium]